MTAELVPTHKFRGQIPDSHRGSLDTRLLWLWHQRFGTVQTVFNNSRDMLDHTAATLILQAIIGEDLESIAQLFGRLEGGAVSDESLLDQDILPV